MASKIELQEFWKHTLKFRKSELDAFNSIKREDFVAEKHRNSAYVDAPLPTLRNKTISQPTTVMLMTHALSLKKGDIVLEVGSGSGYHAAIIAQIVGKEGKVITTEIIPELVDFAKENLKKANIENVFVYEEDGSRGMEEHAPFDKIILTCAAKEFPKELLGQLKTGGIIVGPIGNEKEQEMIRGTKDKNGKLGLEFLGQFIFSPMYGKYGFLD